MSSILKTNAVVLKKLNYGDTSLIVSLFTKEYGKMSGIVKGARSKRSKSGAIADLMNHIEIVFYQKENRDLQLISQLELIDHYPKTREDLDKLKYSSAVIELIEQFTVDHEPHEKLFRGTTKILKLINDSQTDIELIFSKFFVFFLKEIGYELQLSNCTYCKTEISLTKQNSFDFVHGILCDNCCDEGLALYKFSKELLKLLSCISTQKEGYSYNLSEINALIKFLEKYLMYQVPEFKGLKALRIY